MNFDLSQEQKILQESARGFLAHHCPIPRVRELMETETALDESLWRKAAEQGWLGMTLSEADGGLGVGLMELAVVFEEIGRACAPGPFLSALWAATLIAEARENSQPSELLGQLASGDARATVALLESDASWDTTHVSQEAVATGDGLRLNGHKTCVMDAGVADHLVVAIRLDGEFALVIVPREANGVTVTPTPSIDPTRRLCQVDLRNVTVDRTAILARGDRARSALARSISVGAVAACADLVGGMDRVLEASVEYAKTRKQFGQLIGSFQAVQHQCSDMLLMLESSRSATYYAAWAATLPHDPAGERNPDCDRAVSIAKAYCSDAGREVGNRAIQVHGGIGFTWEHDLHLYYRRAKASELMFGDATFHREMIARLVMD